MNKLIFLLCLFIAGCKQAQKNSDVVQTETIKKFDDAKDFQNDWSKNNTVVFHTISEPDNLHPTNGNSIVRSEIVQYIHRPLLYIDFKTMQIVPGLVESLPEISPDSLRYTYKLKKNVRWDDGTGLSAEDVLFTAKAIKCSLVKNPSVKFYWDNVKDIEVADEHTVTFVMHNKNFQNISFLTAFPVLQRAVYDQTDVLGKITVEQMGNTEFKAGPELSAWAQRFNDDSLGRVPERISGLGMYRVESWEPGQYITLVRKPGHWTKGTENYLESAFPEKIIFQINKDEAAQMLDFRNQRLDVSTNCSVNLISQLKAEESFIRNYNSTLIPTYNYTYLCFNQRPSENRLPLFTDMKVRRAIALLTNVNDLTKITYREFSSQCKRMVSNVSPIKKEFDQSLLPIENNPSKAKELLTESGWTDNDNDGWLDKKVDGKQIKFSAELLYLNTSPEWRNMAMYLAEQYAKSGIELIPVAVELKLFLEKAKTHDFDMLLGSWGGTGLNEDYTQLWHTSSWTSNGSNYSGYGNEESDRIIEAMKLQQNDSGRFALSHRLQKMIYENQPYVFLYSSMRRNILHQRFGNQVIFSERPGILCNNLRLLSKSAGITMADEVNP